MEEQLISQYDAAIENDDFTTAIKLNSQLYQQKLKLVLNPIMELFSQSKELKEYLKFIKSKYKTGNFVNSNRAECRITNELRDNLNLIRKSSVYLNVLMQERAELIYYQNQNSMGDGWLAT